MKKTDDKVTKFLFVVFFLTAALLSVVLGLLGTALTVYVGTLVLRFLGVEV